MRRNSSTFRARAGRRALDMANAIRKVVISTSLGSDWGILGYEFENPDDGSTTCEGEDDDPIPVFQGIGIYARPVGENAEGVMLHVGCQADHPILTAVRDEDGRRAYVEEFGDIGAGEIVVFNGAGKARVLITAAGAIEVTAATNVGITAGPGGTITAGAGGLAEPTIKGTTYRTAEDLLFVAISALGTAIAADPLLAAGTKTAGTAVATAVTAFSATAVTYLATVLKGE